MKQGERLSSFQANKELPWQRYLLDTLLAALGALTVTGIIYFFALYPRIPNISIVYLLVVLALASIRGRYAASLTAVIAFLAFDFFIVPPLYTFTIARPEEWIALFVFLAGALLTGQLAALLRQRAQEANRRERETHTLYDLVRAVNSEEEPGKQLQVIVRAIVEVFSSWGVYDCAILQTIEGGTLRVVASAYQPVEQVEISSDERALASWVIEHGRVMGLYDDDTSLAPRTSARFVQRVIVRSTRAGRAIHRSIRLIPLKAGQHVVGVLRLRVLDAPSRFPREEQLEEGHEHSGAQTAFFWAFLDQVTALMERARLQRETLRMEVLQRTDALRSALLSSVSHDLRTPLSSIKAAASSLLQEDVHWDEETRRSFACSIEREADRLNHLVGNLLDMSRIEGGALRPEKEWYLLADLIRDVLRRLRPLLGNRPLHTHLPDGLPPVEVDYLEIDQVLSNLVENAVRYTPAQSPIEVSLKQTANEAIISVADRGPGIPPADLERIFDKFYRVLPERSSSPPPSGSGLGLAVSKGLVEAHNGHIWAENRAGGGAVFSIRLPVGQMEGVRS